MTRHKKRSSCPSNSVGPSPPSNGTASTSQETHPATPQKLLIVEEILNYHTGKKSLAEACAGILDAVEANAHLQPMRYMIFHRFMSGAVNVGRKDVHILPKFGHFLAYCLHKQKDNGRNEILDIIAKFCNGSVEFRTEIFREAPSFWTFLAEVLSNALLPTPGLFEGDPPTLKDFKMAFIYAAKDTRKPYSLFIQVLKRSVEIHCMREKDKYYGDAARKVYRKITSGVAIEDFKSIIRDMDVDKLTKELKNTKTNFHCTLYDILQDSGCL